MFDFGICDWGSTEGQMLASKTGYNSQCCEHFWDSQANLREGYSLMRPGICWVGGGKQISAWRWARGNATSNEPWTA